MSTAKAKKTARRTRRKPTKREPNKRDRFVDATRDLRKLEEEIAPFVRARRFEDYSTAGQWRESSNIEFCDPIDLKVIPKV